MSVPRRGYPVHGDQPRIVDVPAPRDRQLNHRRWTELVNQLLPPLWSALSTERAPVEMRHEACVVAWLRLTQQPEVVTEADTATWLLTTARIELGRVLARYEMVAREVLRNPRGDKGALP
ncbi:MAG: hypothetical protein ACJ735_12555 [Actinomycetes bacterium]